MDAFIAHYAAGNPDWPDEQADAFVDILDSYLDPDKALAYITLAAWRTDDGRFLAMIGAGLLEDLLNGLPDVFIERVVAEGRRSPRFRWLLNCPFQEDIPEPVWEAIRPFRWTRPFEEPRPETLPAQS